MEKCKPYARFSGRRKPDEPAGKTPPAGEYSQMRKGENGDYTFYYNNIRDNVAKRIAAYLAGAK